MFSSPVSSVFLILASFVSISFAFFDDYPTLHYTIYNTDEFQHLPQGVELIPLNRELTTTSGGLTRYTYGQRVPNDEIKREIGGSVGPTENTTNIQLRFKVPITTTFLQIDITQNSTSSSEAYYSLSNGSEKKGIYVIVVANNSYYVGDHVSIYGLKDGLKNESVGNQLQGLGVTILFCMLFVFIVNLSSEQNCVT
ncbi:uncharacterized protein LOC129906197 [Episyrphus balteatus]|uniref:uncharacterized protein LOC129906197 n=1 Tax=Episyrphus balteatus TaxID=286459 RepID=UPI0024854C0C|nr:uncharacterized protein LOC129906197 [Episyrphus balteatus]